MGNYSFNGWTDEEILTKAYYFNLDVSCEVMEELLDRRASNVLWVFEKLAYQYLHSNGSERDGIDFACYILTGYNLVEIAQIILNRCDEYFGDIGDVYTKEQPGNLPRIPED